MMEVVRKPATCRGMLHPGDTAIVLYEGKFLDGRVFDSNVKKHLGFAFVLGAGKVVQGWEIGTNGMCIGEKRRLVIPSHLAYGKRGQGRIPPDATLTFEIELIRLVPGPGLSKRLGKMTKKAAPAGALILGALVLFRWGVSAKPKDE